MIYILIFKKLIFYILNNIYKIKMGTNMSNKKIKSSNQIKLQNNLDNIKSKYILKKIFDIMEIK